MLRKKVLLYTLLMMLSAFVLGCADSSVPEETTLPVFYTVRYWVEDRIIWEEAVEENALPTAPSGENGVS